MAATMPGADKDPTYVSASISLIVHPRSPRCPTGAHEHPLPVDGRELVRRRRRPDAHAGRAAQPGSRRRGAVPRRHEGRLRPFDPEWHPKYKAWCDEYFYLPHRKETRGVGGIFYDRHNSGDFEKDFGFTRAVGEAFLDVYPKILSHRMSEPWGEAERHAATGPPRPLRGVQPALRPRHHVRPEGGGNIDTILSSMPPMVAWT
jgi:coproporphyrinogen III oxidase